MREPAWASGLRSATDAFFKARGFTVGEELARNQDARAGRADARAERADLRAQAGSEAELAAEKLRQDRLRQEIEVTTQAERRKQMVEDLTLRERDAWTKINSGRLESLIPQAGDAETQQRLSAAEKVLPSLSPEAQALFLETVNADVERGRLEQSVANVQQQLSAATQGDDPLMDEETAKTVFAGVDSFVKTGEGIDPGQVLQDIAKARQARAAKKHELAMTQRMFGKIATMLQTPGIGSDAGVEKASAIMSQAMEFPPENEEGRRKLWSEAMEALLETGQKMVTVLGDKFEDVSGWSKGGQVPNVRQVQELELIAASLLTQQRHPAYTSDNATAEDRKLLEEGLAKSLARKFGWAAWPESGPAQTAPSSTDPGQNVPRGTQFRPPSPMMSEHQQRFPPGIQLPNGAPRRVDKPAKVDITQKPGIEQALDRLSDEELDLLLKEVTGGS